MVSNVTGKRRNEFRNTRKDRAAQAPGRQITEEILDHLYHETGVGVNCMRNHECLASHCCTLRVFVRGVVVRNIGIRSVLGNSQRTLPSTHRQRARLIAGRARPCKVSTSTIRSASAAVNAPASARASTTGHQSSKPSRSVTAYSATRTDR